MLRRRLEKDLQDEIAFHLEMSGETPEARKRFGNPAFWKERTRELWTFPALESAGQDLRYAWRVLRREPWLFAGAALVLALGVGANSAVLSLAHAVLLEPLPYEDPERVVMLRALYPTEDGDRVGGATRAFADAWRERSKGLLTDVAAVKLGEAGSDPFDLVLPDRAERLMTGIVTPNFFEILGVKPALGRLFTNEEPNEEAVVLSHGFWQQAFGGDPDVLGRSLMMTSGRYTERKPRVYTVVGVLPREFRFAYPREMQVWALHSWASLAAQYPQSAEYHSAVGRLEEGVTPEAAAAGLADALDASRFGPRYKPKRPWRTDVRTIHESMIGETRPAVLLLLGVSSLLLLVACVAVAGVLLVRLDVRRGELALRAALGAGRVRLTRQLLTEGLLLAALGAAGGVALALATVPALRALVPAMVPRADAIALDARVLSFGVAVALAAVLTAALTPALQAARSAVSDSLKEQGSQSAGRGGSRLRSSLVAAQAALATAMLIGATLLLASFWRLNQVDLGFRGDQVVTAEVRLLEKRYFEPGVLAQFQNDLLEKVRAVPGVLEAGMTSAVPFRGTDWTIRYGRPEDDDGHTANRRQVDPAYFSVMGLKLKLGRLFSGVDTPGSEPVAVVSESAARDVFGRVDVLGERLALEPTVTIVGVVSDARYRSMDQQPQPAVYVPRSQDPSELICLVVRAAQGADVGPGLRAAVREVDPTVPLMRLTTIDAIVSESVSDRRFYTVTTVAFAALALLIAATGLAVVVTRSIAERRKELAIRAALGARPRQLAVLAMRRGLTPALAGTALGLWAAWTAAGLLERFLFEASPHEPWVYLSAAALSLAIAALGSLLPTRRIGRWSPATELKAN
ncbi:MAG: ABC transporter permease [Acidobacteria bacterium]|nr:ABC transporter permease [Acidobacteriota bacterium]